MFVHRNALLPAAELPGIVHTTLAGCDLGARRLSIWRQRIASGAATPPHRHDCEEVVLVEAGRGRILVDGRTVEFGTDSTIVLPANCDHQIINDGDEPLMLIAAFSATPVGTFTPGGASIDLPWST
jgi:mannose-6-phosphate isomerase-like protein (cupin superfamily)